MEGGGRDVDQLLECEQWVVHLLFIMCVCVCVCKLCVLLAVGRVFVCECVIHFRA